MQIMIIIISENVFLPQIYPAPDCRYQLPTVLIPPQKWRSLKHLKS